MKPAVHIHFLSFFLLFGFAIHQIQNVVLNDSSLDLAPQTAINKDDLKVPLKEEVILHLASNIIQNDLVFFKGYIRLVQNQKSENVSSVLIIDLLDASSNTIAKQLYKISNGEIVGNFRLPKRLESGKYHLRAYTRWMKNYTENSFSQYDIWVRKSAREKEISDISEANIIPEGGTLINGLENRLIMKFKDIAHLKDGGIGAIVDEQNNEVAQVYKHSRQLATSIFKPLKGKSYHVELLNQKSYAIPKALDSGFLLQVSSTSQDRIKIFIKASRNSIKKEIKLVGHIRGVRYLDTRLEFENKNEISIEIDKENLPDGILNLELLNSFKTLLAKRPVLIDVNRISIVVDTLTSFQNSESLLKLKATDLNGNPIQTQLSLSISQNEESPNYNDNQHDYLNLISGIGIKDPNTIRELRKHNFINDLEVQLVNRRFAKSNDEIEKDMRFKIQKGLELEGYAYDLDNRLLRNTAIQIIGMSKVNSFFEEVETDDNGLLSIKNIDITGNSELVFRTKGETVKSRLVKVRPVNNEEKEQNHLDFESKTQNEKLSTKYEHTSLSFQEIDSTRVLNLEEVKVVDKKTKKSFQPFTFGITPSSPQRTKFQDAEKPRSIAKMISEFPGVIVKGMGSLSPTVSIPRTTGAILYVVDGIPLMQPNSGNRLGGVMDNPLNEVLSIVQATDVNKIELLIGADAAVYGSRGAGGVFQIYTRSGGENQSVSRKDAQLKFQGYEPVIEFNTFLKSLSKKKSEKMNLIYWNPNVQTDENGEVLLRIKKINQNSSLNIKAIAVTNQPRVGVVN